MRRVGPLLIIFLLIGVVILLFVRPWANDNFDRTVLGDKGLELWLQSHGVKTKRASLRINGAPADYSMRIMPLPIIKTYYDNYSSYEENAHLGRAKMSEDTLLEKLDEMPTMLVWPKWQDKLLQDHIAEEKKLIPTDYIVQNYDDTGLEKVKIKRLSNGMQSYPVKIRDGRSYQISLYDAQLFDRGRIPPQCHELIGIRQGALLLKCNGGEYDFTFLSDPDLLNNHGLALEENAAFATAMIRWLADDDTHPVYLDAEAGVFDPEYKEVKDEGRTYERKSSDFARLFDYPLNIIWGMLVVIVAICFWRGLFRFGPAIKNSISTIEMSKTAAVDAMARLLRLSGNDGRMVAQYVQNMLMDKAALVFGAGAATPKGVERLLERLSKKDKELSKRFRMVIQNLVDNGPSMGQSELHQQLEYFRDLLRRADLET